MSDERARELGLSEIRGAVVGKVEEGSPGQKAGLKENDVILSFNQQPVQNRSHFHRLLIALSPGSNVPLVINRDGKPQRLSVTLGEKRWASLDDRERLFSEANALLAKADELRQQAEEARLKGDEKSAAEFARQEKGFRNEAESRRAYVEKELSEGKIKPVSSGVLPGQAVNANRVQLGITAAELSPQLAKYFNVPGSGVLVTEVRAGEPAERAGVKAGDCIVMINGERISAPGDLAHVRFMKTGEDEKGELLLTIVRDRVEQTLKIKLDAR